MRIANNLKAKALDILMGETFTYLTNTQNKELFALAQENSALRQNRALNHFTYNGQVYPNVSINGMPLGTIKVDAPFLHSELHAKFNDILKRTDSETVIAIKNFFVAVLSKSFNNIVLDKFIPTVLSTAIKKEFDDEQYQLINFGTSGKKFESIDETKENIRFIEIHYAEQIELLREILMERFLMEG